MALKVSPKTCCDHAPVYHGARGCDECTCSLPRAVVEPETAPVAEDAECTCPDGLTAYGNPAHLYGCPADPAPVAEMETEDLYREPEPAAEPAETELEQAPAEPQPDNARTHVRTLDAAGVFQFIDPER